MVQQQMTQKDFQNKIERTVQTSPCLKCAVEISTEATKCPACGYEPKQGYESEAGTALVFGFVSALTIVGIVIAIPLWWYAAKCQRKAEGMKPTNTKPDKFTKGPNI